VSWYGPVPEGLLLPAKFVTRHVGEGGDSPDGLKIIHRLREIDGFEGVVSDLIYK